MNPLRKLMPDDDRRHGVEWKGVSTLSAIVGGIATRKVLDAAWGAFTDGTQEPPLNPADRRIDWPTALKWAITAGVGMGVGRMVSQRMAAAGWEKATGSPPPGLAS